MFIKHITDKFYTTENERLRKIEQNQQLIQEFTDQIKDILDTITSQGIRLWIFEICEDTHPPMLYAGLGKCCNEVFDIEHYRHIVEESIYTNTKFKKIIWEI